MDNKTLRAHEQTTSWVILVVRDGVIKGIAADRFNWRGHVECTVTPRKMKKFKNEKEALGYFNEHYADDNTMVFHKIAKLEIAYTLITPGGDL